MSPTGHRDMPEKITVSSARILKKQPLGGHFVPDLDHRTAAGEIMYWKGAAGRQSGHMTQKWQVGTDAFHFYIVLPDKSLSAGNHGNRAITSEKSVTIHGQCL